ncbi:MAG TPA: PilZ domain-containing protein [Candidatus Sulfotelmatobacter sp.]|nr:PilZ domain-containing protein [Candidatus Sulfotelmatobacter sp.]
MDLRKIEPRRVMWAVAEVSWADAEGTPNRAPATIQDMSVSGACIRLKAPIRIGSRLTVKWHREQFSAVARNCRRDGGEFLLGVRRDGERATIPSPATPAAAADTARADEATTNLAETDKRGGPGKDIAEQRLYGRVISDAVSGGVARNVSAGSIAPSRMRLAPNATVSQAIRPEPPRPFRSRPDVPNAPLPSEGSPARRERKAMPGKTLFPQFWRRQPEPDASQQLKPTEAPVNKTNDQADAGCGPRTELLSYEDIYHAAGIMSPRSGYGIHKVVEMLNSERIRDLSKDVKRASVLMALEAAGASVDELLQDATRRQHALNSYEEAQRKQLEEFETRKSQENAKIQAEMERLNAHYAERMQRNRDLVAREKEALHNWQMAKQHESQRIGEVTELCGRQPAATAMAAAAGQGTDTTRDASHAALLPEAPRRS